MNITWHGQTCFRIITQKLKEGPVNILIDPFEKEVGLRVPKTDSDILLITSQNKPCSFCTPKKGEDRPFMITGPGEYDIKGAYVKGLSGGKGHTIYVIDVEDMRICHLGLAVEEELTDKQIEEIGEVDILMVPVGGGESVDGKGAIKIMSQIEPRITIPMYYNLPGLKEKLEPIDNFLKALGIKSLPPQAKLSVKKKDLPSDEAKIIALES